MSSSDHLMPHSPSQRKYSGATGMELGSSSGSDSHDNSDSNISDMVVDVKTKFTGIKSNHHGRGQDGDFVPSGGSNSKNNSGSDSESNSNSNSKSGGDLVIADDGNGYSTSTTNSRNASPQRSKGHAVSNNNKDSFYRRKIGQSPAINRDSPFKFNRSKTSSKYSYSLCPPSFDFLPPQRRAAANIRYNYSDDSDQSKDSEVLPRRPAQRRGRRKSDSEFEMSGCSEEEEPSNSDSFHDGNDDLSEEDFRPTKRKGKVRKRVSLECPVSRLVVLCLV